MRIDIPTGDDKYEIRVTRLTVLPPGEALFAEYATDVELQDEAAGEFVVVTQKLHSSAVKEQQVYIDRQQWPPLRAAIDYLIANARGVNQ